MRTLILLVLSAVVGALLSLVALTAPAVAADRDCGDFRTQAAAQQFFLNAGGPRRDPHGLDYDGDGVACESNPCPCSTSTSGGNQPAAPTGAQRAKITRVVDGDTVHVRLASGARRQVRLVGIDTPEVSGRECGHARATGSLRRLAPVGSWVRLVRDGKQANRDRYGRLLRYVVRSGKDVNRAQVARGWAKVLVVGRGFDRVRNYRGAQSAARAHRRGVWRLCR